MILSFKRYEKKYLVTHEQAAAVTSALLEHMEPDQYGTYWVQNLYFDTDNWDVVRMSMERPLYKEKLRLRCYGVPEGDSNVFLELKKKYIGVVYKRRIALPIHTLTQPLRDVLAAESQQIARELDFYLQSNPVIERMFIAFRRTAFTGVEDEGLRITFDRDIRYRRDNLGFANPNEGQTVLQGGYQILEVKTFTSMPLWLSRVLSENGIYGKSYSKYGTCFTDFCEKGNVKLYA